LRTIESVLSTTLVEFRIEDTATAETGLDWRIVRIYATEPPKLTVVDEINGDLMTQLKGSGAFTVDKYCFESGWDTKIGVGGDGVLVITATSPSVASPTPVSIVVTAYGDLNVITGLGEGKWKLTDATAVEYFLETTPTENLEVGAGRAGTDGTLSNTDEFSSPTAVFTAQDVGRQLRISGSGSGNNNLYRIKTYIDPNTVELQDAPLLPEANSGSLTWAVVYWTFEVIASTPPDTGAATVEYECPTIITCDYCQSHKILISGTTSEALLDPMGKLVDRLNHVRAHHAGLVFDVGYEITAAVEISATVTTP
jgi:hypothetical protein